MGFLAQNRPNQVDIRETVVDRIPPFFHIFSHFILELTLFPYITENNHFTLDFHLYLMQSIQVDNK